jgi:protein-L-isoaspartate(D-aspartate) O-methyltransferase
VRYRDTCSSQTPQSKGPNSPEAVVTHRDAEGVALSSSSAPGVVASMLEQLDVQPGHRVLEIGAGTGYNAALLAYLAGRQAR